MITPPTPDQVRAQLFLPPGLRYLNCAYQAPISRPVEEAGIQGIRAKRDPSVMGPDAFFRDSDALREAFAHLLAGPGSDMPGPSASTGEASPLLADPTRVALHPSVSYGVATCARNAGLGPGDEIILLRDQFPGNVYGWMRAAEEAGARVRFVDPPDPPGRGPAPGPVPFPGRGRAWNTRILEAMGPRTRVVSLGPVHWTDGTRFDLEAIGARAREVDALLVVDGTQSVGALPFDLDRVRPDALLVAGYKWLLGPYATTLAWYGPAFDQGTPLEESWIAREGSRDFAGLVNYRDGYEPGAVRYDVGERSNFVLVPMLLAALELLQSWGGPGAVAAHGRRLQPPFLAWARDRGFGVDEDGAQAPHLFGIGLDAGSDPARVSQALAAQGFSLSVRGRALRISLHLWNEEAELDALAEALEEATR